MNRMSGWKKFGLGYFFLSLLGLLINLLGEPLLTAAAPPNAPPKMQVRAGYDGYYKQASWLPIQFNLTLSENNPTFNGWIEASQTNFDPQNLLIRRIVQLPAPSNRTFWLYMPIPRRYVSQVQVRLTDQNGQVLATDKIEVRPLSESDLLVGVLGNDLAVSNLTALNGERLTLPFNTKSELLANDPYMPVPSAPGGVVVSNKNNPPAVHFVRLNPTDLPTDTAGWESLDGLAVSNLGSFNLGDPTLNTPAIQTAAAGWLAQGRFLFVAGDESLRKSGFLADLLPVKAAGSPQTVKFPTALSKLTGAMPTPATVLLADTTLLAGATAQISENNKPLLAKRNFGLGTAYFLATDFGSLSNGINRAIWQESLRNYEPLFSYATLHRGQNGDYRNWLNLISPSTQLATIPDILLVFFNLIFYVMILGPVGYFILKKTNKREWGWLFAPGLAIALAGAIYVGGRLTEGDPLVISRLTIMVAGETTGGKISGTSTSIATIYSNQRIEFQMGLTEDSVLLPLDTIRFSPDRGVNSILTYQQGPAAKYERIYMGLSDRRSFIAQKTQLGGVNNGFHSELKLVGKDLSGTLENRTGADWVDVKVWLPNGRIYSVPTLQAGAKINIDTNLIAASSATTVAGSLSDFEQDGQDQYYNYGRNNIGYAEQRYYTLASLIGESGQAVPANRVYIIAWKRESLDFPLRLENQSAKQMNLTLFLQAVNLQQ